MTNYEVKRIGIEALQNAKKVHDALGADGLQTVQKNQFGETALRADLECEEAIFEVLRRRKIPARIISEEHGVFDLTPNPVYLGIVDGIDGSSVYIKERGIGRYATLLGIYPNLDPLYEECIFSGAMEHGTSTLYHALLGGKALMSNINGGRSKVLHTSEITKLEDITLLFHTREYNAVSKSAIGALPDQFPSKWVTCAARSYVDIASGVADAEVEVTRKGNLEQMAIFRLMDNAGAVMVGMDGKSIGKKHCLSFGQQESIPLITAATQELALALRDRMVSASRS